MRALTKRERVGALVVDVLELEGHTHLMHRYQENFGEKTILFWRNRLAISILVTISSFSLKYFKYLYASVVIYTQLYVILYLVLS